MRFGGLIAAIVIAAIAAVVVLRMGGQEAPAPVAQGQQPQLKTVNIYVAAKPITIGSTITQEDLAIQPWPEHLVLPGFILADQAAQSVAGKALDKSTVGAANIVGTVARAPFQQQEPIIQSKLANPNDPNFLAGELPKGMRVITIQTNETEGLAGFVFPGDHVDVILTHEVPKVKGPNDQGSSEKDSVSETLLNNVMVLAVDQRASGAEMTDKDGKLIIPRSVSLMVSPTDAQRVRLGQKIGTLTLSLRALADRESADPMTITNQGDISQYKGKAPESGGGADILIYRGIQKENLKDAAPPASPMVAVPNNPNQAGRQQ